MTQLAQTRELESKMEDLQQQIDRTKCILNNYDSGDLLLLNYMASRLFLLRELTSRDYDDFFTARAQYSTWCKEQQQLYLQITENSLNNQKIYLNIAKTAQNTGFEQTKRFLSDITRPSDFNGTSDEIHKFTTQFKVNQKLSFDVLSSEGEKVIDKYSELSFPSSNPVAPPTPITIHQKTPSKSPEKHHFENHNNNNNNEPILQTPPKTHIIIVGDENNNNRQSPAQLQSKELSQDESNSLSPRKVESQSHSNSPSMIVSSSPITSSTPIIPEENKLPISLIEYQQDLASSLNHYEQHVCNTMEKFSELALQGIRKKFTNLRGTEGNN